MRRNWWVTIDGREYRVVLGSQLIVPVGIGAPNAERTVAIPVEITALDGLIVGVGYSIIPFVEGFSGHGVSRVPEFMDTVRERALGAEVAAASRVV